MTAAGPLKFDLRGRKVWIAGHTGMVGSALLRRLAGEGCEVVTLPRQAVDLRRQAEVEDWLRAETPDAVILAAATVGGIVANDTRPAEFLYDNLAIETNIIHGAWRAGVGRLVFLGSACAYPRDAAQPVGEDSLLAGPLEPTNEFYAVAKIAGIKLCQAYRRQYDADFIAIQPVNGYGPGDNFDPAISHVIPALLRRAHEARESDGEAFVVWGTGRPLREFLYVDDMADAIVFLTQHYDDERPINVGGGEEITIRELAETVLEVVGLDRPLVFDETKPDGMARKTLDSSRLRALGWRARVSLKEGLERSYRWYLKQLAGQGG